MAELIIIGGLALIYLFCGAVIWYTIKHKEEREERWRKRYAEYIERTGGVIVEVKYLGAGRVKQKRGGLGGALLGGFFGGPLGAMVGAVLPDGVEKYHRFAVKYQGGDVEIREVHRKSREYRELMARVAWEDL